MIGKCSEFGGANDPYMQEDDGLALYQPLEADRRPDIFFPEDPDWLGNHPDWAKDHPGERQPTWSRLRTDFYYIAMRYDHSIPRKVLQNTPFKVRNPQNNDWAIAFMVDWGPGEKDRLVDCSGALLKRLGVKTENDLDVTMLDVAKESVFTPST